jgi:hypothetical protein
MSPEHQGNDLPPSERVIGKKKGDLVAELVLGEGEKLRPMQTEVDERGEQGTASSGGTGHDQRRA